MAEDNDEIRNTAKAAQRFFSRLVSEINSSTWATAYRNRLAPGGAEQTKADSASQVVNGERKTLPSFKEANNPNYIFNPDLAQEVGGELIHITRTDPVTGNVINEWLMKAPTSDGHTTTYLHREGGLPAYTETNAKGIVVAEEYSEWGVGSKAPDGSRYVFRDPDSGARLEERRTKLNGGWMLVTQARTGFITVVMDSAGELRLPNRTPNLTLSLRQITLAQAKRVDQQRGTPVTAPHVRPPLPNHQ